MNSEIWYLGEYSVAEGKAEAFEALMKHVIDMEHSRGADVLHYEFYFNGDRSKYYAIELFATSSAVLAHMERGGDAIQQILELAELTRFEIYGSPTQELKDALSPFGATFISPWAGFTRLSRPEAAPGTH